MALQLMPFIAAVGAAIVVALVLGPRVEPAPRDNEVGEISQV